ncbi:hypothetical protein NE236_16865 [Actinoallomurus purpureus]|uniref:hypothetical protein n=1 Tax=Actinoallomurus purpureus TaxID=478114 RepID=UPI0020938C68|nr:hypothetical protein [Actinoallomurus purpureus]MCO6006659.1 hypothetical protein [Actinoallomurus purpureus]
MLFIAYADPAGTFHHPNIFYIVIAVVGVALVAGIVVSLLILVLRNINKEWPIR